ncbi:unnamed protein product, partial [Brenthis ino]
MLRFCLILVLVIYKVKSQYTTCENVNSTNLDLPKLDGRWYFAAVATNFNKQADCAMVDFNHKNNNTTDISITWVVNNTASFHNGSVFLTDKSNGGDLLSVNYKDNSTVKYSVLGVDYEHYIALYACSDNSGNITYELWKLTRSLHLKETDAIKLDQTVRKYNLQNTTFVFFINSEDSCKINAANHLNSATLVMSSAASIALLRRFF